MSKSVDFSRLTLQDALDLAILVEEEAKERYEELADQMDAHRTPEAAAFFRLMVTNEAKHGEQLLQRRRALFGSVPANVSRGMLWDVEAPDYDEARAFMSAREAMQVAFAAETKAHDYFVAALEHVADRDVRALFEELREDERVHKDLVQKEIAKLPPDSGVNPEDWVDEPVDQ